MGIQVGRDMTSLNSLISAILSFKIHGPELGGQDLMKTPRCHYSECPCLSTGNAGCYFSQKRDGSGCFTPSCCHLKSNWLGCFHYIL